MELDCLLAFLNSGFVVALAKFTTCLVAYGIERQHLSIVVLIAVLFLQRSIDICQCAVIVCVVFRCECLPPTSLRRVLLV